MSGRNNLAAQRGFIINPAAVLTAGLVLFWGAAAILLWHIL